MFLFLDVVSTIPEFHLINDKKIIDTIKITKNNDQKLSDRLIPAYLELENTHNLSKNISKLIITIGPGSYTALRVGAAFIAGLSQSMSLPVSVISNETFYNFFDNIGKKIGIYFESSNNQNFFTYKKNSKFYHEKIDNENYVIPESISCLFYNTNCPKFVNPKMKSEVFVITEIVLKHIDELKFKKKLIIKPIYISNNHILN